MFSFSLLGFLSLPKSDQAKCTYLSQSDIKDVGSLHNKYVQEAYSSINCSNDCRGLVINYFENIDGKFGKWDKTFENIVDEGVRIHDELNKVNYDLSAWKQNPLSQKASSYIDLIDDAIDKTKDLSSFNGQMNTNSAQASKELSCKDLETVQVAISVAKSSAKLWMPKNMGGNELTPPNHGLKRKWSWSWRNAVKSDIAAAAGYFFSLAGVLAATSAAPPANAAIAVGIAIASGVASAIGGTT